MTYVVCRDASGFEVVRAQLDPAARSTLGNAVVRAYDALRAAGAAPGSYEMLVCREDGDPVISDRLEYRP